MDPEKTSNAEKMVADAYERVRQLRIIMAGNRDALRYSNRDFKTSMEPVFRVAIDKLSYLESALKECDRETDLRVLRELAETNTPRGWISACQLGIPWPHAPAQIETEAPEAT